MTCALGWSSSIGENNRLPDIEGGWIVDFKLELVLLPVADVDRAKKFYTDELGFNLDVDVSPHEDFRIVQMTPPGSACSITVGRGITDARPDPQRADYSSFADFSDPDGNTWVLQERHG
jgi:catechol 2,3-dioxygenase-like lactoylglutathione lyase family enzyme